jgi:hypothetical protein
LRWNKVEEVPVTHYAVTYGEKWLDFDYGASNIGDTDTFVVTGLKPGTGYYFVVTAVNKCASSGYSDGAANYAGGSVVTPKVSKPESTSAEEKGFEWEYQETNQGKGGDIADQEREDEPAETDSEDDDSVVYVPETETKDPWITGYLPWIGGGLLLVLLGFLVILLAKKRSAKNPEPERGSDVQPPEEF